MAAKRQKYTKEFKEQAVMLVLKQGLNHSEVGRKLGVHATSIANWIRAYEADGKDAFPGNGKLKPADEELRRLREEVRQLRMERDFLKKTAQYFAKDRT